MNDIDKLTQSIETLLIEAQDCILGIINVSEGSEIDPEAKVAYDLLGNALIDFAQLCNALEGEKRLSAEPKEESNLEKLIRELEGEIE